MKGQKTGGRKKGTLNKATRSLKEAFLALKFDIPEELVNIYNTPDLPPSAKLRILEMLLPYVAPRLKDQESTPPEPAKTSPSPASSQPTESLLSLVQPKK